MITLLTVLTIMIYNCQSVSSWSKSLNFILSKPKRVQTKNLLKLSNENNNIFYNDFDDQESSNSFENESNNTLYNSLQKKLNENQLTTLEETLRIESNLQRGNWNVRGFSLDSSDTIITSIALNQDNEKEIVVGRSDGSIVWMEIGNDYLTSFRSKQVLEFESKEDESNNDQDFLLKKSEKLVESSTLVEDEYYAEARAAEEEQYLNLRPFKIIHQFPSRDCKAKITCLLFQDLELFVASGTKVYKYCLDPVENEHKNQIQWRETLVETYKYHLEDIHTLEFIDSKDANQFASASKDAVVIWNLESNNNIAAIPLEIIQLKNEQGVALKITCFTSCENYLFLGSDEGHTYIYNASTFKLLYKFKVEQDIPMTNLKCFAMPTDQYSIKKSSSSSIQNSLLLFIANEKEVKLYQLLISASNSDKVQHWPRLPSQKLTNYAHIYKNTPLSANLQFIPSNIIISSNAERISFSSCQTGETLYVMEGFEDLSHFWYSHDLGYLVCNGLNQFVCFSDFNVQNFNFNDDDGLGSDVNDWLDFSSGSDD